MGGFTLLFNPMGLVLALSTALAAGILYLSENWTTFIKTVAKSAKPVRNIVSGLLSGMGKAFGPTSGIGMKLQASAIAIDLLGESIDKGLTDPPDTKWKSFGDTLKDVASDILGFDLSSLTDLFKPDVEEIEESFEEVNDAIQRGFGTDLGFDGAFTLPEEDIASFGQKLEAGCNSWANKVTEFFDKWGDGINMVGDIFGQMMENQSIQLENRHKEQMEAIMIPYEQELANIENSMMSEEQKAEAKRALDEKNAADVKALEEKTNKERAKIQRKQAIADKAAAIIAATINGAQAITKVAGQTGIGAIAAAPIIAGLVAAQIGTIAAQPIPKFAEGGLVSGPTMGMVGEYAGARSNPEVIAPLDKLQSIMGNQNVNVTVSGVLSSEGIQIAAIQGQEAASQKGASLIGGNFVTTPF